MLPWYAKPLVWLWTLIGSLAIGFAAQWVLSFSPIWLITHALAGIFGAAVATIKIENATIAAFAKQMGVAPKELHDEMLRRTKEWWE